MHANAGRAEAAFHHHHVGFHRRISAGKNERRVYESDKEGVGLFIIGETTKL
jgi:hypothetical protein